MKEEKMVKNDFQDNEIMEILYLNKLIIEADFDKKEKDSPKIKIQFLIRRRRCLQIMFTNGLNY